MPKHVLVIGAGIIGASIAYHLAKSGARVTIIDAGEPGGIATRASWAWINGSWGNPETYVRFRMRSMAEWRTLADGIPALGVRWCGSLNFELPPAALAAYEVEHGGWGYRLERLSAKAIGALEPNLNLVPESCLFAPDEGVVEPLAAAQAMLAAAVDRGAVLRAPARAVGLVRRNGRVKGVHLAEGMIEADEVVLAAGTGSVDLMPALPIDAPPGLLVHSAPAPQLIGRLILAPELHIRQTAEGRLVAGSDFGGAAPGEAPAETAVALYAKVQLAIRGAEHVPMAFHTIGYRPTPRDGLPIIGRVEDGLYVAVMHSGVTNAPAVGLFAAQEILQGRRDALLAPFAPERLQSGSVHQEKPA